MLHLGCIFLNKARFPVNHLTALCLCIALTNVSFADDLYVFVPTDNTEIGTRVLEVEQWRSISNTMTLVGIVRRDVLTIIKSENNNNKIKKNLFTRYN